MTASAVPSVAQSRAISCCVFRRRCRLSDDIALDVIVQYNVQPYYSSTRTCTTYMSTRWYRCLYHRD